jgi:nicotinamidase-related amidase
MSTDLAMDTAKTALVAIDLHKGITFHDVISNAARLTDISGPAGHDNRDDARSDLIPAIDPFPSDGIILKRQWGALSGTDQDLHLR